MEKAKHIVSNMNEHQKFIFLDAYNMPKLHRPGKMHFRGDVLIDKAEITALGEAVFQCIKNNF